VLSGWFIVIIFAVEMTFNPDKYTITESVGSLSPTIRLSQPSHEAFNFTITLMDVNTTGNFMMLAFHIS